MSAMGGKRTSRDTKTGRSSQWFAEDDEPLDLIEPDGAMPFLAFEIVGRGVRSEPDHPFAACPSFNRVQKQFGDAASTVLRFDPEVLDVCRSKVRSAFGIIPNTRVNHS